MLSTSNSQAGLIVESDDAVFVLNENRWQVLLEAPVHSVRSYLGSKRYKHLVTIVTRERVELAATL